MSIRRQAFKILSVALLLIPSAVLGRFLMDRWWFLSSVPVLIIIDVCAIEIAVVWGD